MQTRRHAQITKQPAQPRRFPPFAVTMYGTRSNYVEDAYSGTISVEIPRQPENRYRGHVDFDNAARSQPLDELPRRAGVKPAELCADRVNGDAGHDVAHSLA